MKGKQRDLSKDLDCTWEHRYFPGAPQCPYPYKDKIDNRTEQRPKKKKNSEKRVNVHAVIYKAG